MSTVVERRSLAGELFMSCARPAAKGDHLRGKPSFAGQPTRPTKPLILSESIDWVVSYTLSDVCLSRHLVNVREV